VRTGKTLTSSVLSFNSEDAWNMKLAYQIITAQESCLLDLSRRKDSSLLITRGIFHVPYAWPDIFPPAIGW